MTKNNSDYKVGFMADDPDKILKQNNMSKKNDNVIQEEENGLVVQSDEPTGLPLVPVDMNNGDLPDLSDAQEFALDLMADYWSPTSMNESKRVFYDGLKTRQVVDQQTGEALELLCAFFFEKTKDGVKTISNGSKRLVGIFESGQIHRGTPLLITYLGKKRNATNSFLSDNWSVKPLILKVP